MKPVDYPDISICIPVYNGAEFIRETVKSVLDQSFKNFELIILDNASKDETSQIIQQFNDPRIKLFSNIETVSAHQNWSAVVSMASAPWTKLLCADDILVPGSLEHVHGLIQKFPDVEIFAGTRNVINEQGCEVRGNKPFSNSQIRISQSELIDAVLKCGSNPIGESCCITWKSELTNKTGLFSQNWKYFIDVDYWIRLAAFSDLVVTPVQVASFRISSNSWTSNIGMKSIREAIKFFQNHESLVRRSKIKRGFAIWRAITRAIARKGFSFYLAMRKNRGK